MNWSAWLLGLGFSALVAYEVASRLALTRRLGRGLLVLFVRFELACLTLVRQVIRPRFVLLGECHKRGVCCRQIIGDPPRLVRETRLVQLFVGYHRVMHNFAAIGKGPDGEIIFACNHLDAEGRCGIYALRPFLCRNYPVLPFYAAPQLLPGCGFRAAPRVVARMKNQPRLPIVNPHVAVHHPTAPRGSEALPEHFELVDDWCPNGRSAPAAPPRGDDR
jgi:Fe-S-cluster containining protein